MGCAKTTEVNVSQAFRVGITRKLTDKCSDAGIDVIVR